MPRALAGCRILIVEDEGLTALDLEKMLLRAGCRAVAVASTLGDAVKHIGGHAFDAALLDINLSGELVYPAADALAARGIPFVFLTGYPSSTMPERFRAAPVCRKPCAQTAPLMALKQALGR
jgi:CheY-like chemotaxis protein